MKKMSFEESITRLEDIVRSLEEENLSLDDSLSAFEEAIGLAKVCNEALENAERKVKLLVESADGAVSEKSFDIDTDEA